MHPPGGHPRRISMNETPSPSPPPLLQFVTDYPITKVIHVAAQLRLADLLAAGPRRIEDLADATGAHAPSLARLLRMLAARGVAAQEADGRLSLTPLGAPLRAGVPGSVRDHILFSGRGLVLAQLGQLTPQRTNRQAGVRPCLRHEQFRVLGAPSRRRGRPRRLLHCDGPEHDRAAGRSL